MASNAPKRIFPSELSESNNPNYTLIGCRCAPNKIPYGTPSHQQSLQLVLELCVTSPCWHSPQTCAHKEKPNGSKKTPSPKKTPKENCVSSSAFGILSFEKSNFVSVAPPCEWSIHIIHHETETEAISWLFPNCQTPDLLCCIPFKLWELTGNIGVARISSSRSLEIG